VEAWLSEESANNAGCGCCVRLSKVSVRLVVMLLAKDFGPQVSFDMHTWITGCVGTQTMCLYGTP